MNKKQIIQRIVVGAVIFYNNKILILQRNKDEDTFPNMWELPSGKREPREPSEQSLIREVKEETGLDVEILSVFSVFDYQINKKDEISDSTQINFLVRPIGSRRVRLSDEHQAYQWITEDQINDINITNSTKEVIQKAFSLLPKFL